MIATRGTTTSRDKPHLMPELETWLKGLPMLMLGSVIQILLLNTQEYNKVKQIGITTNLPVLVIAV